MDFRQIISLISVPVIQLIKYWSLLINNQTLLYAEVGVSISYKWDSDACNSRIFGYNISLKNFRWSLSLWLFIEPNI